VIGFTEVNNPPRERSYFLTCEIMITPLLIRFAPPDRAPNRYGYDSTNYHRNGFESFHFIFAERQGVARAFVGAVEG